MRIAVSFFNTYPWALTALSIFGLFGAAFAANFTIKRILLRFVNSLLIKTSFGRDKELGLHKMIERLANIMPAVIISVGIFFIPELPNAVVKMVSNVANAMITLFLAISISAFLNIVDTIYHRKPNAKLRPIKGYLQILKIVIYITAAVMMIATMIDRSPLILLSGLGAIAAVLILVFQDTLLSLVAGIQISSTDMVRVGDWVEIPGQNADGDIVEIALHTVKVQNWDKTITTVPIRKLVTDPVKNWRGMQQSGGRRIKRAIHLDQSSICFLSPERIAALSKLQHLDAYLHKKYHELKDWNEKLSGGHENLNLRQMTNIGTFRAYVEAYLRSHPRIRQDMTLLTRQLAPGPEGLPLELYCFTDTVAWISYEAIQADIFDHLFAIIPEFELSVFQKPSGADFKLLRQ